MGLGFGLASVATPSYLSEVVPPVRGLMAEECWRQMSIYFSILPKSPPQVHRGLFEAGRGQCVVSFKGIYSGLLLATLQLLYPQNTLHHLMPFGWGDVRTGHCLGHAHLVPAESPSAGGVWIVGEHGKNLSFFSFWDLGVIQIDSSLMYIMHICVYIIITNNW